jgi:TolA-binding protein
MSVVDLHPENLLDKEIRGELDASERQRLEAHLAQCATCRLERQLRADFALELSRDSVPPEIADLVDSLAKRKVEPPVPVLAPSRARRTRIVLVAAAAMLTVVAGAFASTETGRRVIGPLLGREAATRPYGEATSVTAAPVARPPRVQPPATASSLASPAEVDPPAAPQVTLTSVTSVQAVPSAGPPDGPAPLFGAETEARRRGDTARVLELHAELVARYPQSREAQVSRMMVARLLLDRGDAAGALSGFDAYLRAGSGELREDALAGRATALDRLGRTDDARRAWAALLDQYPNSAYGAHARSRVEASGEN